MDSIKTFDRTTRRGSGRLATCASISYGIIPAVSVGILLIAGSIISRNIVDDTVERLARQYSIEANANFQYERSELAEELNVLFMRINHKIPLIVIYVILVFSSALIGNVLVRKMVLTPLFKLTQSVAADSIAKNREIFGLDRDDEIGELARTIDEAMKSLNEQAAIEAEARRIEAIEESNKAKNRFLARMSHEIRTPITAVLGISEIQLRSQDLPQHIKEDIEQIYDSSKTLLGIVNDILDFSKIESGNMELIEEEYEVARLVYVATRLRLMYLEHKNITFDLKVDENLPCILVGDELRIRQIIDNLLSNAFKYTEKGIVTLSLQKGLSYRDGYVNFNISIRDTGYGMAPQQLDTLTSHRDEYKSFYEYEGLAEGGTGLGVAIVYSLAQMMDATVEFQSEAGAGTSVFVSIPQKKTGGKEAASLGKKIAKSLQNFEKGTWTNEEFNFEPEPMPYGNVLIVDDVEANLYVAKGLLAFYEINVETVTSGQAAIDNIKEKSEEGKVYDIVFMDQTMPELSGTETMQNLRGLGYSYPIVALTANALVGQEEEFLKNGFDGFISKPIQSKSLHDILIKFIKDKQQPETLAEVQKRSRNPHRGSSPGHGKGKRTLPSDGDVYFFHGKNPVIQEKIENYQKDPALLNVLRPMFVDSQKYAIDDIYQAVENRDIKTAHRLAHTLKSSAWLIYETRLAELAKKAELMLLQGEMPAPGLLAELERELSGVLKKTSGAGALPEPSLNKPTIIKPTFNKTTSNKPTFNNEEVLIVEDAVMTIKVICENLSKLGLKCIVAKDGTEAVNLVKKRIDSGEKPYDLILMDIIMPIMDGREAAAIISTLDTGTPIVAMTAATDIDEAEFKSCGMDDYIGKPFTEQDLWRVLLRYLDT